MSQTNYRHLESSVQSGVLVITVTENQLQDEKLAQAIQDELLSVVNSAGLSSVVVDLRNIRYVSSVAFRPLLRLRRHVHDAGGKLVLCGMSRIVGDVFFTTKLVSPDGSFVAPFEMAADAAAAVERITSPSPKKSVKTD
jgi:anti-anti-sigma factor